MSSLSSKSDEEILELLNEYGIKHGPVVDSTRGLYEKKLKEVMSRREGVKPSPDKTFYREEEEETTYVSYRTPLRTECSESRTFSRPYMRTRPEYTEREFEDEGSYSRPNPEYRGRDFVDEPYVYDTPSSYRKATRVKSTPMNSGDAVPKAPASRRLIPLWVQFLSFLAVAAFLYFVFSNMETAHSDPFKAIQ